MKHFNILDAIPDTVAPRQGYERGMQPCFVQEDELGSVASAGMESTSAMENMIPGSCPKCKKEMTKATLADGYPIVYCESDNVALPFPDYNV